MMKQMICGQLRFRYATTENVKAILQEVRNLIPHYVRTQGHRLSQGESMEDLLLKVIRKVAQDVNPMIEVDHKPKIVVSKVPTYIM